MAYSLTKNFRTDKVNVGFAEAAATAKDLYHDFAVCPYDRYGLPSMAHGVPNNEIQYPMEQNRCNDDGFRYRHDLETDLRPQIVYSALKAEHMYFGDKVPGGVQAQGQNLFVQVKPKAEHYQDFLNSYLQDKDRRDFYTHTAE